MAPLLHIMRHGQGYHSQAVSSEGHNVRDPYLTPKGEEQCMDRRDDFERHEKVELLLASPLRRALQTCAIAFEPVLGRGLQIVALPMAEEASDAPCDTGSEVEVLQREFPKVDFDHLSYGWFIHEGEYATDPASLNSRAAKLRQFIRDRPEREVVLVSHGFFNHYLTGDVNDRGEQTTPWWKETELRTYSFIEGHKLAMIKETDESLLRRDAIENGRLSNIPKLRGKSISV